MGLARVGREPPNDEMWRYLLPAAFLPVLIWSWLPNNLHMH